MTLPMPVLHRPVTTEPARFQWSHGRDRYDVTPRQHEGDLGAFARFVHRHRARDKATAGFVSAPLQGSMRRSRADTAPRNWIALDVDGIDPAALVEWRLWLCAREGFGWPTASSTPEAPRERVILTLSRAVDYMQAVQIGDLMIDDAAGEFGAAVRIDASTFRGSQPCFLPLEAARLFFLQGGTIDVDLWLPLVKAPLPMPAPAQELDAQQADTRMRWLVQALGESKMLTAPLPNGRGYAMRCPWERRHTTATTGGSGTALLFPSDENGWRGAFRCLHTHCEDRRLRDLEDVLRTARTTHR